MRTIEDHAPSNYEQHRSGILLISFDEFAELEQYDWLREATKEEIDKERERLTTPTLDPVTGEVLVKGRGDFDELSMHDRIPYMWAVVEKHAPGHIWRQATSYLRLRRFKNDG